MYTERVFSLLPGRQLRVAIIKSMWFFASWYHAGPSGTDW